MSEYLPPDLILGFQVIEDVFHLKSLLIAYNLYLCKLFPALSIDDLVTLALCDCCTPSSHRFPLRTIAGRRHGLGVREHCGANVCSQAECSIECARRARTVERIRVTRLHRAFAFVVYVGCVASSILAAMRCVCARAASSARVSQEIISFSSANLISCHNAQTHERRTPAALTAADGVGTRVQGAFDLHVVPTNRHNI